MSSNGYEDRLARAIESLSFAEPVETELDDYGTVKVQCRVKGDQLSRWAKLVEDILRAGENTGLWHSHICRLYMLRNDQLVYGWLVAITSPNLSVTMDELVPIVRKHASVPPAPRRPAPQQPPQNVVPIRRPTPEADAKGNPIVPDEFKMDDRDIPMAGLHPNTDRNAPKDGRGSWTIFNSKRYGGTFKPPRGKR
jgi:hypothetical protein